MLSSFVASATAVVKYLFINEVLEAHNNYINDNILGKFYKKDFAND